MSTLFYSIKINTLEEIIFSPMSLKEIDHLIFIVLYGANIYPALRLILSQVTFSDQAVYSVSVQVSLVFCHATGQIFSANMFITPAGLVKDNSLQNKELIHRQVTCHDIDLITIICKFIVKKIEHTVKNIL
jgi:hypothetical protein